MAAVIKGWCHVMISLHANFNKFILNRTALYITLSSFSDVGEIWTRLFDHRPFLSGEIKFFLKEFEVRSQKIF
jgi:hypothetical protein